MNTCESCQHWHPKKPGVRMGEAVGECRAHAPGRDFTWPRTAARDYCSEHTTHQAQFATAATVFEQTGYKPGQIVPMNGAGALPNLDAGTTGDAPPPAAIAADDGPGNRRRGRAKA